MSALALLTGPDATDLLAAATATAGGQLLDWRVGQIDHQGDDGTTVAYTARVAWGDGERDETLAAYACPAGAAPGPDAPGTLTVSDGVSVVRLWCVPYDPELPGLAAALDPSALGRLLGPTAKPELIAYRPRRRAVVRVTTDAGRAWVKVLRPDAVEALHARHRLLHDAGVPVPRSLGWSTEGLLLLEDLPGTPLRRRLRSTGALPSGHQVLELLARFPPEVTELPRRRSWSSLSPHYARVIGEALPSERERAAQLGRAVTSSVMRDDGTDPTHGDFYEAQLMAGGGAITGVLDVDTAGPGHRADDLACALAHLAFLGLVSPAHAPGAAALLPEWSRAFASVVPDRELKARTAGVLLTLATGPHRVGRADWIPRTREALDLAESYLP